MPTDRHLLAAEGYFELEMFDDALEELAIAEHVPGNLKAVRRQRLEVFIAMKRWEDAHGLARELHAEDPDHPGHRVQHAFILRELDRVEEARSVLLDGSSAFKRTALFHYNLGCYEALLGNPESALHSLHKAFALSSELRGHADTDRDLDSIRDQLPPKA
jgi:predicted Zn-dependent protease